MKNAKGRKRVVIIDDHILLRQGLERLLDASDEFVVCGEAGNAAEAVAIIRETRPDAAIVDIGLPGTNGIELTRQLTTEFPGLPILILSMHEESEYAERARAAGATAYIAKSEAIDRLQGVLRDALIGRATFQPGST